MNGLLAALAVAGSLVVITLVLVLLSGWRPGGRSRTSEALVRQRLRRELDLGDADWREVERAVAQGVAAPERLRPAAYELARRVAEVHERSFAVRRPRAAVAVAVAFGLGYGALFWIGNDTPWWLLPLFVLPGFLLTFGILNDASRTHRHLDAAVEANRG